MDPTTTAHTTTNAPIHPAGLAAATDHTGAPILTTTSFPSSSDSTGASNLAAPKSSAPTSDPIAGLSASTDANASSVQASADKAKATAQDVKSKVNDQAGAAATGVRKRLNSISHSMEGAADHPAVKNARAEAGKQVEGLRQQLGRYPLIVQAEKRTGVDRVLLVFGGVLLYIILIPLNLFRLALPTTQLLTFLPPSALAVRTLERPHEERTKLLLSYFVVFGFVQFIESLMAGFLEKRIPQYYTVKLLFLAYLIHPKTKGAFKIHQSVLRPLLAKSQGLQSGASKSAYPSSFKTDSGIHTPPSHTARSSDSSTVSTGAGAPIPTVGGASSVGAPLSRTGGFSGTGPSEGFSGTE